MITLVEWDGWRKYLIIFFFKTWIFDAIWTYEIVMMDVDQLVSIHYSLWLKLINLSHSIEVIRIEWEREKTIYSQFRFKVFFLH